MTALKIDQFGGMLPAWDPHLLPGGQAAYSQNGYLFSGALEGWRVPTLVRQLKNAAAKFVYRVPTVTQTAASAFYALKSQPNPGDTCTIGDLTYTFVAALNSTSPAFSVWIGANVLATATNLLAAITLDNGAKTNMGILYGNQTTQNSAVNVIISGFEPPPGLPSPSVGQATVSSVPLTYVYCPAPDFGAAYNSTPVSESTGGVRALWLSDLLSIADTTTTYEGGANPSFVNNVKGAATWLEFVDADTDVIRSQVANDQFNRYYVASPSQPPQYSTYNRVTQGLPFFRLGVPAPGCAPTVTVSGGGNDIQYGTQQNDGNQVFVGSNTVYLFPIQPTGSASLQDIQFVPETTDPNVQFAAVCYADANQAGTVPTFPGALLNVGIIETGLTAGTTAVSQFTNPNGLLTQTVYWVGIMINSSEEIAHANNDPSTSFWFQNTFANGPPGVAPGGTSHAPNLQMWADVQSQDVIETRAYLYTWVSAYNEEGPPSPPTLCTGWSNGVWTVGLCQPPANDLGTLRNLAVLRLYRTVTAVGGQTTYFWVADVSLGSQDADAQLLYTSNPAVAPVFNQGAMSQMGSGINPPAPTYTDNNPDNLVGQNIQLPSATFFPPPEALEGMVNMPNGVTAGYKGQEIWFCQPYSPHAWPPGYTQIVDFPIIGLGVTGGALVVLTSANPYVLSGINPAAMSMVKCTAPHPALTKKSIISLDAGVYYPSPNGLIQVGSSAQAVNQTELWITREEWQQLTPQNSPRAIYLVSQFLCFGSSGSEAQSGYSIELDADTSSFTVWPQPGGHRLGFQLFNSPLGTNTPVDNIMLDPWTGAGLLVMGGNVYQYDFGDPNPVLQSYDWKSKVYQSNTRKNYTAMRLFFTKVGTSPTPTGRNTRPPNDASWNTLGPSQLAIVKVYADPQASQTAPKGTDSGLQLVCAREVQRSGELLRIPSGFKAENWQFEIIGRVVVSNLQVATSAKELANV